MLRKFASNAGANVASGAATAAYQLGLTALATHAWRGAEFAAWALALSLANIAPLFGGNLSSVVTRRLVHARHGGEPAKAPAIVAGATLLGQHLAVVACVSLLLSGLWAASKSDAVRMEWPIFATMLVFLIAAHVWVILWQTPFGQSFAVEDNWAPARTLISSRGCALFAAGVALWAGVEGPLTAAVCLAGGAWIGLGLERAIAHHRHGTGQTSEVSVGDVRREYDENLRTFAGFAVWSVGALVIQYGVPPLVAVVAPELFSAFYLASTLNLIAIGALTAAMSALLAPLSRWHALGHDAPRMRMVSYGPLICGAVGLTMMGGLWFFVEPMLDFVASRAVEADRVKEMLALLGVQTLLRVSTMGYSVSLASAGSTSQMSRSIVVEMGLSLMLALPLGLVFGLKLLMLGLIAAAFVSALYTCHVALPLLCRPPPPRARATACLLGAQALVIGVWCWLSRAHLG